MPIDAERFVGLMVMAMMVVSVFATKCRKIRGHSIFMLIWRDKNLRVTIWKIAWPAMGEMTLYMLVGVVDVAVVGRLGEVPLAAASLGAEIFFSLVLFLNALGVGASVLVAQAKGGDRLDEAAQVAGQSLLMALFHRLADRGFNSGLPGANPVPLQSGGSCQPTGLYLPAHHPGPGSLCPDLLYVKLGFPRSGSHRYPHENRHYH